MTDRAGRIRDALGAALEPVVLEVVDDSASHAGHGGARAEGETHYNVMVVSARFEGVARVGRHRMVNQVLAGEFERGLHALSLVLRTPSEAGQGPV